MSEDAPRLSRKQMREQGLLKTVTEGTSPMEKLQMTQEIDLGRLSRRQMRELERQAARQREEAPQEAGPRRSVFERFEEEKAPATSARSAASAHSAPSAPSPVSTPSAPSAPSPEPIAEAASSPHEAKPTVGNSGGVRWPGFGSGTTADVTPAPSENVAPESTTQASAQSASEVRQETVAEPDVTPETSSEESAAEARAPLSPYDVPAPARRERVSEELPRVESAEETPVEEAKPAKSSRPRIVLMYVIGALVGLLLGIPVGLLLKNLLFSAAAGTVSTALGALGLAGGIPGLL